MDGGERFKTKPRPRSSYSLITLTSQTTQIINEEETSHDLEKQACSSIVPRARPIIHSRRSPFLKQRLASNNVNFSQSISVDVINSEDMHEKNYCDEVILGESEHQVISTKIYINESKQINTSSLWHSGFIEIINEKLHLIKVNKNISKAEKSPSNSITIKITPQLILNSLQRYYVCKYGTKVGFEIGLRKSIAKDTLNDVLDHAKSPLIRIAFNQFSTAENFHKYLLSKISYSKCSLYYMFHELSCDGFISSDPTKDHIIYFEVDAEILLNMNLNNGIKTNKGFISIGCCLSNLSNYRKPIFGFLETLGFDELNLTFIRSHSNYRKTSYNDAYTNQLHLILPKRLNKICLLKYSFKNQIIPIIKIQGNITIKNSRTLKIDVIVNVDYNNHRTYRDIKKLVLSVYLPASLCNLFLVKNGYSNNFLMTKEAKKLATNNSGTSKLWISKGRAYYDEISGSIKWIFDFENLFEKTHTFGSILSLFRGTNTCKNGMIHEIIEEQLKCVIRAPFDIILTENKESSIRLDHIFRTTEDGLSEVITSRNVPVCIKKATVHYVEKDQEVYLPNIHIKYSQTITAFYDVNIVKEDD